MAQKSIIIIGAGIAGLSAGCYAQMNGFQSQILELHSIPGGLCTSWRRKGYTMDGCLQYVTGSGPGSNAYPMWQELGALGGKQVYDRVEFTRVEDSDGRNLVFYTDVDRFEDHLLSLAPGDADVIKEMCEGVRLFSRFETPLDWPITPQENLEFGRKMLPFLLPVLRWNGRSLREYAERFHDPLLREGIPQFFQFAHPTFPMTVMLMTLALLHRRCAGYPIGGSLKFALGIVKRYEALGGKVHYRSRVTRILVENDRAVGVELEGGEQVRADYVISAADGYDTIFTLLDGRYVDDRIRSYYKELPIAGPIVQVSLGVNLNLSDVPHCINFRMHKPRVVAGKRYERLVAKHYGYDPTMAPAGKSVVTLWLEADFEYWKRIYKMRQYYDDVEDDIADIVLDELDHRIPGLRAACEVVDVATPPTYERFTENWRGAIGGWSITSRKMKMMMGKGMKKQLSGLSNFYMIGQWVEPAGNVELSAASGRDAIKRICLANQQPFTTSLPPASEAARTEVLSEQTAASPLAAVSQ